MDKIKILQYTGTMNMGGAETLLMNLYRNMNRNKYEFHFVTHSKKKCYYYDEIIKLGGKIIYIDHPTIKNFKKYSQDFKKIIKNNGPYNAIHSHVQLFNGIVLREAKRNEIPNIISHAHLNGDYSRKTIKRIIYKNFSKYLINNSATYRISCSNDSGKYLYGNREFKLLNNAIDINKFKYEYSNTLIEELGLKKDNKIITHIGSFKEAKNHNFIIEVFRELVNKDNRYELVLVGKGNLEEIIKKKVIEYGIEKKVHFLGLRDDIPQILKSTDIFFMPSILEGLPVVLVEAQAAGVSCVISNTIPKECDMGLNLINFLSLNENIETWVDLIINTKKNYSSFHERKNKILKCGYDLEKNIKFLEELYAKN